MHIYTHMYMHISTYICTSIHVHIHTYIHTQYTCPDMHTYTYTHIYRHAHTYVHTHICTYTHTYIHTYTHTKCKRTVLIQWWCMWQEDRMGDRAMWRPPYNGSDGNNTEKSSWWVLPVCFLLSVHAFHPLQHLPRCLFLFLSHSLQKTIWCLERLSNFLPRSQV